MRSCLGASGPLAAKKEVTRQASGPTCRFVSFHVYKYNAAILRLAQPR